MIEGQSQLNIGTVGHVDHGKTTIVWALSGQWAARHSEEMKRGVTLKLGYADVEVLKCPKCPPPQCYTTSNLSGSTCKHCGSPLQPLRKFSFVDCPGHEMLMATMLAGATLMDGALLVIDTTVPCPQPQTREHLKALEIIGVKNIVIVQNKVDVVSRDKILENYEQITEFVKGTIAEGAPIIPISALHRVNLDILIEAIEDCIKTPSRDESKPAQMLIARSFDVNKPGTPPDKLKGGVIGGAIAQGVLRVGDEVEIRPGLRFEKGGHTRYEPIFTRVTSLVGGGTQLKEARPGGLIGVGTMLDPSLTKADSLVGNVAGKPGTLPPTRSEVDLEVNLLERAVGTVDLVKVENIKPGEQIMITVGTATSVGVAVSSSRGEARVKLRRPICCAEGARIAISRPISGRFRLIGYGIVKG